MRRRLIASGRPFKARFTHSASRLGSWNRPCPQPHHQTTSPRINSMTASCASPRSVARFPAGPHEVSRQARRFVGLTTLGKDIAFRVSGHSRFAAALALSEKAFLPLVRSHFSFKQPAGPAHQGLRRLGHPPAVPNPSFKPSPNGKPPGRRYSAGLHFLQRRPGALPSVPA